MKLMARPSKQILLISAKFSISILTFHTIDDISLMLTNKLKDKQEFLAFSSHLSHAVVMQITRNLYRYIPFAVLISCYVSNLAQQPSVRF